MSGDGQEKRRIDPLALPISDASRLLSSMGFGPVTEAALTEDLESGAPRNADGTLNLIHYAAWLLKERVRGD